jgi:hypothetical protein
MKMPINILGVIANINENNYLSDYSSHLFESILTG